MKTMICVILDRSGSMGGRENDVINGVNSFIEEQKKLPDPAVIALVRFDTEAIETFRSMGELSKVAPLNRDDFKPRGGTPLLDAVGKTVAQLDDDWKREKPERAIVVIVTDGEENSSHEYTKEKVKNLIQSRQESGKWAFIYLGANVDAFAEARAMGVSLQNAAGYTNTVAGNRAMYAQASLSVSAMRTTGATLATNLGRNIGEDEKPETQSAPWVAPQTTSGSAWTPPS